MKKLDKAPPLHSERSIKQMLRRGDCPHRRNYDYGIVDADYVRVCMICGEVERAEP